MAFKTLFSAIGAYFLLYHFVFCFTTFSKLSANFLLLSTFKPTIKSNIKKT